MSACTDISLSKGTTVVPQNGIEKIPERVKLAVLFPFLGGKDLANLCASKKEWQVKLVTVQVSDGRNMRELRLAIRVAQLDWIDKKNPDYSQLLRSIH